MIRDAFEELPTGLSASNPVHEVGGLGRGLIYGGVQILKPDGLRAIDQRAFSLNVLWNQMQENGRLFAAIYPGKWCDVGHPEGITLAEEMLAGHNV